jgi:hypothetical protein
MKAALMSLAGALVILVTGAAVSARGPVELKPATTFHRALHALLGEDVFVVTLPKGDQQSIVAGIEVIVARAFGAVVVRGTTVHGLQEGRLIVAVEMYLVCDAVGRVARLQLVDDIWSGS